MKTLLLTVPLSSFPYRQELAPHLTRTSRPVVVASSGPIPQPLWMRFRGSLNQYSIVVQDDTGRGNAVSTGFFRTHNSRRWEVISTGTPTEGGRAGLLGGSSHRTHRGLSLSSISFKSRRASWRAWRSAAARASGVRIRRASWGFRLCK